MTPAGVTVIALAAALATSPAPAFEPVALNLPPEARKTGQVNDPPGRYGVAVGVWDGSEVPFEELNGTRMRMSYRLPNAPGALAGIITELSDAVADAGFELLFSCAAVTCGGFDFRYRLDVLPLPQMYVDLGRFRYLSAARGGADGEKLQLIALLASASGEIVNLQVDLVTPLTATEREKIEDLEREVPTVEPPQDFALSSAGDGTPVSRALDPGRDAQTDPFDALSDSFLQSGAVVLDDLVFASGSSDLTGEDHPSLDALAAFLEATPGARIALVGHTDTTGSLEGNIAVSRRRAEAVADRLAEAHGVDRARLTVQGAGFLAPRADNRSEEGRARNRRVTAVLLPAP